MTTLKNCQCRLGVAGFLVIGSAIFSAASPTFAQIKPDTTLGVENSVIVPNAKIGGFNADQINGGAIRGANLFHSFSEFNVSNGQRVYFTSPTGIENILSRITGNKPSNIFGTLGVNGTANLFLINPNGIIFGQNAQLDISGSFLATTTNNLVFGNKFKFSATHPEAPPLLTIKLRPGLQYGSEQSAAITNTGSLAVGKNLTLAAGNLNLQGQLQAGKDLTLQAENKVNINDSVANPFIAKAGRDLLVWGNQGIDISALNHPNSGIFAGRDLSLRSANTVRGDAHYTVGGDFRIEKLDGSLGNFYSSDDPILRARGDVSFTTYTGASLHILAGGSVNIGSITITGVDATGNTINPTSTPTLANVTLSNGIPLIINGTTQPTLDIRSGTTAFETPGITGNNYTTLFPLPNTNNPATNSNINIGSININAPNGLVYLTNQYQPNTSQPGIIQVGTIDTSRAVGNGGDVIIDSKGDLVFPKSSYIKTSSAAGNSGKINVLAQSLSLTDAFIDTSTFGKGNAGDILIQTPGTVSLINSDIFSNVEAGGIGNGGRITIKANSLYLTNGAQVQTLLREAKDAFPAARGNAGNVNIEVSDTITIDGKQNDVPSAIFTEIGTGTVGKGGDIDIKANLLVVTNGAFLSSSTYGDGIGGNLSIGTKQLIVRDGAKIGAVTFSNSQGGNLTVNATDSVELSGVDTGLFASTEGSNTRGNGGILNVDTEQLIIRDGAQIVTSTSNNSQGGFLSVNASKSVEIIGARSGLFSESLRSGIAGDIKIITPQLIIQDGGSISASTARVSTGNGGNLTITSKLIEMSGTSANLRLRSSLLTAATGFGNAGNLQIDTDKLIVRDGAVILTSTLQQGKGGNLTVNASDSIEILGVAKDNLPSGLASGTTGPGVGGDLTINTRKLTILDGGAISAATYGQGPSGNLKVKASELVSVVGKAPNGRPSGLAAGSGLEDVYSIGLRINPSLTTGNAGEVQIDTKQLIVSNGGEITTATIGSGTGGNIAVKASEAVKLSNGGGLLTETKGSGNAGNLTMNTSQLTLEDGGKITLSSSGFGTAGNLDINARTISLNNQARITAETKFSQGGNIAIQALDSLQVRNSRISASTDTGSAGNVTVNTQRLELSDEGGLRAEAIAGGTAGSLAINAGQLTIQNSAIATVSSPQGQAGNLTVTADSLFLNRGSITAVTGKSQGDGGANISLNVADLIIMGNESQISADALATANGGNINIDTGFLIVLPPQGPRGSDIAANAFLGNGGRVSLTLQGIFGTEFRPRQTPFNDITASSDFGIAGVVTIDRPDVDPSRGLASLPTNLVDATGLIDRQCAPASTSTESSFTITGRGGLPPNPNETLGEEDLLQDLGSPVTTSNQQLSGKQPDQKVASFKTPKPLVEAQSWIIGPDGNVNLTELSPNATQGHLWTVPACYR